MSTQKNNRVRHIIWVSLGIATQILCIALHPCDIPVEKQSSIEDRTYIAEALVALNEDSSPSMSPCREHAPGASQPIVEESSPTLIDDVSLVPKLGLYAYSFFALTASRVATQFVTATTLTAHKTPRMALTILFNASFGLYSLYTTKRAQGLTQKEALEHVALAASIIVGSNILSSFMVDFICE